MNKRSWKTFISIPMGFPIEFHTHFEKVFVSGIPSSILLHRETATTKCARVPCTLAAEESDADYRSLRFRNLCISHPFFGRLRAHPRRYMWIGHRASAAICQCARFPKYGGKNCSISTFQSSNNPQEAERRVAVESGSGGGEKGRGCDGVRDFGVRGSRQSLFK